MTTPTPLIPANSLISPLGSIQAMKLGALPMQQLADAVNWCNSSSYTPPTCVPWVDLPQSDSVAADSNAGIETSLVAQIKSNPTTIAPVEPLASSPTSASETIATTPSSESESDAAQAIEQQKAADLAALKAKELAEQELAKKLAREQAELEKAEAENIKAEREKAEQEKTAKEKAAHEKAAIAAAEQAAKIAREQAEARAQERSKEEELAQKAREEEHTAKQRAKEQAELQRQESMRREAAAKREAEELELAAKREAEEHAAGEWETLAKQEATQRDTELQKRQPIEKNSAPITAIQAQPRRSAGANTTHNQASAKAPIPEPKRENAPLSPVLGAVLRRTASIPATDEYLSQLERLVLELNMELARRNNEQQPVDPIEQLTQRIIALNLENLALREQIELQKQSQ